MYCVIHTKVYIPNVQTQFLVDFTVHSGTFGSISYVQHNLHGGHGVERALAQDSFYFLITL